MKLRSLSTSGEQISIQAKHQLGRRYNLHYSDNVHQHLHCFCMKMMHITAQCGTMKLTCTDGQNQSFCISAPFNAFFSPTLTIGKVVLRLTVWHNKSALTYRRTSSKTCFIVDVALLHNIYMLQQGSRTMDDRRVIGTFNYDCQLIPSGLFKVHHNNGEGEQEQIHWPVLV